MKELHEITRGCQRQVLYKQMLNDLLVLVADLHNNHSKRLPLFLIENNATHGEENKGELK